MKIYIFTIITIFIMSFAIFGQKPKARKVLVKPPPVKVRKTIETIQADIKILNKSKDIWANYDKFDNKTSVFCKVDSTLFFIFVFNTDTLSTKTDSFLIRADSLNSKYKFSTYNRLQFIADEERVELNNGRYQFSYDKESGADRDMLFFTIDVKTLQKIINAKKVEYRVGTYESYLTDSEKDKLKALITLVTPY